MASSHSAAESWHATVWKLESGFFARDRELVAAMGVHQFSTRVIPYLTEATQFFRVRVEVRDSPSSSGEIWVVFIRAPGVAEALARGLPDVDPRLDELRPHLLSSLPDSRFCFVTDDRKGYARIPDPEGNSVAFAAAVAVVKYYAGWDDSKPVVIATDHEQLAVSVDFTADNYTAAIQIA